MPELEKRFAFLAERARQGQMTLVAEQKNGRAPLKLAILDHKRRFLQMEQDWLADVVCSIQADEEVCDDSSRKRRGSLCYSWSKLARS
jgi:hypothetical protein